MSKMDSDAGP